MSPKTKKVLKYAAGAGFAYLAVKHFTKDGGAHVTGWHGGHWGHGGGWGGGWGHGWQQPSWGYQQQQQDFDPMMLQQLYAQQFGAQQYPVREIVRDGGQVTYV